MLNRLIARQVPSVSEARDSVVVNNVKYSWPLYPATGPLVIPAEDATFDYDVMGNLTVADNQNARIRRAFDDAGRLIADTLLTSTVDTTRADRFEKHVYGLRSEYDGNGRRTRFWVPSGVPRRTPTCRSRRSGAGVL